MPIELPMILSQECTYRLNSYKTSDGLVYSVFLFGTTEQSAGRLRTRVYRLQKYLAREEDEWRVEEKQLACPQVVCNGNRSQREKKSMTVGFCGQAPI
jgi:hypothetical protein